MYSTFRTVEFCTSKTDLNVKLTSFTAEFNSLTVSVPDFVTFVFLLNRNIVAQTVTKCRAAQNPSRMSRVSILGVAKLGRYLTAWEMRRGTNHYFQKSYKTSRPPGGQYAGAEERNEACTWIHHQGLVT